MNRLYQYICTYEKPLAYLIVVLTVIASLLASFVSGDTIKSADEPDFYDIAVSLAFRGEFSDAAGELTAYRAPGQVFFIAPFVRVGAGVMEARMANAVLLGLTLLMVFHLVLRHWAAPAGLFAVTLIPLWPVVLYTSTTLYPQTLASFLLVLTVFLCDRLERRPNALSAVLVGLAYGSLVLTIPITLLLFPFYLAWILWRLDSPGLPIVVFCLVSAMSVGSWTLRNQLVFDTFIPVATSSGYNLLAGNAPNARYNTSLDVRFPEYVYAELTGTNEVEANKIMMHAAFKQMVESPGRTISLYFGKFLHWFDFSNTLMSDTVIKGGASSLNTNLREIILLVTYALVIAGPLLLRLLMIRRYPMYPIEVFMLALWIGAGLAYALFFTRVRFRLPFDWLVITTNAIFLAMLVERWLGKCTKTSAK